MRCPQNDEHSTRGVPLCVSKDLKRPAHADGEDSDGTVQTHRPVHVPLTHTLHTRAQAQSSVDNMYKHYQRVRKKKRAWLQYE